MKKNKEIWTKKIQEKELIDSIEQSFHQEDNDYCMISFHVNSSKMIEIDMSFNPEYDPVEAGQMMGNLLYSLMNSALRPEVIDILTDWGKQGVSQQINTKAAARTWIDLEQDLPYINPLSVFKTHQIEQPGQQ